MEFIRLINKLSGNMGVAIALAVLGLGICFVGLKLWRGLAVVLSFGLAAAGGFLVASLKIPQMTEMVYAIAVGSGLVFAALALFVPKLGILLLNCSVSIILLVVCLPNVELSALKNVVIIGAVAGLLLTILSFKWQNYVIIGLTAIGGGQLFIRSLLPLFGAKESWMLLLLGLAIAIPGVLVQLLLHFKQRTSVGKA